MAQTDLFSQFFATGGALQTAQTDNVIGAREAMRISQDLYKSQLDILAVKKEIFKSDYEGLNLIKRFKSVYKNVLDQQKSINNFKKTSRMHDQSISAISKEINRANKDGNVELESALKKYKKKLELEQTVLKIQNEQAKGTMPAMVRGAANLAIGYQKVFDALSGVFKFMGNIFKKIFDYVKQVFNKFLEIQRAVGDIAATIGLTSKEAGNLMLNMTGLSISASKFGGTIADVATIFKTFSETTQKNRMFNTKDVELLTELGLGTNLGVQGATEFAASFENIGITLSKTIQLTDKARDNAAKMNVNTGKVLINYRDLVKSLTGIGFGRGLENLTKLATKAAMLRFDIAASTKSFSDAFFDPEKAVDASARMVVLGGRFARSFGDPIQLAFESMSDPAALGNKFMDVMKGAVQKNAAGDYFISPADRKMLMIASETLGQDYEMAKGTAIEQAKMADKLAAVARTGFSITNLKEEDRLAIAGLTTLKDGEYWIKMQDGTETLLKNMTDKNQLQEIIASRKHDADAALKRKDLVERLKLIIERFTLGFSSVFVKLFGGSNFESFLQLIEKVGTNLATFINDKVIGSGGLVSMVNDILKQGQSVFTKIASIFEDSETSFLTKIVKSIGVATIGLWKMIFPYLEHGFGALLKSIGEATGSKTIQRMGEVMMLNAAQKNDTISGFTSVGEKQKLIESVNQKKSAITLGQMGGIAAAAITGAAIGSVVPIFGTAIGAVAGALIGAIGGGGIAYGSAKLRNSMKPDYSYPMQDAIVTNKGKVIPYSKGDLAMVVDQAAFIKARSGSNGTVGGGSISNKLEVAGTIRIESNDGKVVTWDAMYNAANMIGNHVASAAKTYDRGFGNYNDGSGMPIKPLIP